MILYVDTSALIRLYVFEPGHREITEAVRQANAVATHLITYAEVRATLARMAREERLSLSSLVLVRDAFERDWSRLLVVLPTERSVRRAGELAELYALRGYDSVQLAAAEEVAGQCTPGSDFVFAAGDLRLLDSAKALSMRILSPSAQ